MRGRFWLCPLQPGGVSGRRHRRTCERQRRGGTEGRAGLLFRYGSRKCGNRQTHRLGSRRRLRWRSAGHGRIAQWVPPPAWHPRRPPACRLPRRRHQPRSPRSRPSPYPGPASRLSRRLRPQSRRSSRRMRWPSHARPPGGGFSGFSRGGVARLSRCRRPPSSFLREGTSGPPGRFRSRC